jgi:hypothetical protein
VAIALFRSLKPLICRVSSAVSSGFVMRSAHPNPSQAVTAGIDLFGFFGLSSLPVPSTSGQSLLTRCQSRCQNLKNGLRVWDDARNRHNSTKARGSGLLVGSADPKKKMKKRKPAEEGGRGKRKAKELPSLTRNPQHYLKKGLKDFGLDRNTRAIREARASPARALASSHPTEPTHSLKPDGAFPDTHDVEGRRIGHRATQANAAGFRGQRVPSRSWLELRVA